MAFPDRGSTDEQGGAPSRPAPTQTPLTSADTAEGLDPAAPAAGRMPVPPSGSQGLAALVGQADGAARVRLLTQLQATQGNRYVQRLLQRTAAQRARAAPDEHRAPDPPRGPGDLAARIQRAAGGGAALAPDVRRQLEPAAGGDLSAARVHTDGEADRLARDLDAAAFTAGADIFFRAGAYDPASAAGQRLLAHEATHVVQQASGPVDGTPAAGGVALSDPADRFEQAAQLAAAGTGPQLAPPSATTAAQAGVQRRSASDAPPEPGAPQDPRGEPRLAAAASPVAPPAPVLQRSPDDGAPAATVAPADASGAAGAGPLNGPGAAPGATPGSAGTTTITIGRASYTVSAKTLKAAAQQIQQREEAGETIWKPTYSVTTDEQGKVTDATVTVPVTVTMPSWPDAAKVGAKDKARWDAFMQALEAHEQRHVALVRQKLGDLAKGLIGKSKADADAAFKQALTDLKSASDEYDTRTDHGRNEGCVIETEDDAKQGTSTSAEPSAAEAAGVGEVIQTSTADATSVHHDGVPPGGGWRTTAPIGELGAPAGLPLVIQRVVADQQIIQALQKPDPVAGVGDFPEAFRILNGMPMYDMLATLNRLKGPGHFDVLNGNLGQAVGVNVPRLQIAFRAVQAKGATTPERFAAENQAQLSLLPDDQQQDIARYLSPTWVPKLPLELLPTVSDQELGTQYALGLKDDPQRAQAVEDEIDRRVAAAAAIVPGGVAAASPATTGTTKVSPDVAAQLLENMAKGEPPWKPELGKGGCAWFVSEGNPYVGVDASKNVDVPVEISGTEGAVVFQEADLKAIYEEESKARAEEVKAEFRKRFNLPDDAKIEDQNSRLRKAFKRLEKDYVETKMWDRVGQKVASSPSKVGKVILKNSDFSKSGDGVFTVVADAKKIKIKGGVTTLVEAMEQGGAKADPVVVRAAEELARKMAWAGRVKSVLRIGGRILIVVAIAVDVYEIYHAEDRVKKTFEKVGGWAGAAAAAELFSVVFAPADTAGPAAWVVHGVGVLVAGGIGYYVGSEVTTWVYELVVV